MAVFLLTGCEKTVNIDADITWTDESYYSVSGDWYAMLSLGISILSAPEAIDYVEVTPGTSSTASFAYDTSEGEFFQVSVFCDENGNGEYDSSSEYITGTNNEWGDPGDDVSMTVEAYY